MTKVWHDPEIYPQRTYTNVLVRLSDGKECIAFLWYDPFNAGAPVWQTENDEFLNVISWTHNH